MWERLREIIRKEFRQALREPRMRAMLVMPPLIQLLVFGYAVNLDVEHSKIAWADLDNTPQSRDLRAAFSGSRYFTITATPTSPDEPDQLLKQGKVAAVVRISPGFGRDLLRGNAAEVQVLIDGTNSNTASLVSSQASGVIAQFSNQQMQQWQRDKMAARAITTAIYVPTPRLATDDRVWFNPDLISRYYFVPGVVVNILTLVTIMLTAMAIVREKEIGTLEQLMVTPIQPLELMLGKTLPFAAIGLLNMVMVTVAAMVIFHVPFRGSIAMMVGSTLLFLMTTLGCGLFISTISNTQQQAMMSSSLFFQPAFMLSGFSFPIRNMPEFAQAITYVNPLRYFMEIVRGVFLKGTGIETLWPQMLALLVFGVTILTFSALRFHKRLD